MMNIEPKSRTALIEAAFQTLAANPRATLADVAAAAGVGRATLHRHFASRDDLMVTLARIALDELTVAFENAAKDAQSYGEALRLGLEAMIGLADRQWFLAHQGVETHPDIADAVARDAEELLELIRQAQNEGSFDPALPPEWIAGTYDTLLYTAWTQIRAGEATEKQAARLAWRTLTRGLAPGKEPQ